MEAELAEGDPERFHEFQREPLHHAVNGIRRRRAVERGGQRGRQIELPPIASLELEKVPHQIGGVLDPRLPYQPRDGGHRRRRGRVGPWRVDRPTGQHRGRHEEIRVGQPRGNDQRVRLSIAQRAHVNAARRQQFNDLDRAQQAEAVESREIDCARLETADLIHRAGIARQGLHTGLGAHHAARFVGGHGQRRRRGQLDEHLAGVVGAVNPVVEVGGVELDGYALLAAENAIHGRDGHLRRLHARQKGRRSPDRQGRGAVAGDVLGLEGHRLRVQPSLARFVRPVGGVGHALVGQIDDTARLIDAFVILGDDLRPPPDPGLVARWTGGIARAWRISRSPIGRPQRHNHERPLHGHLPAVPLLTYHSELEGHTANHRPERLVVGRAPGNEWADAGGDAQPAIGRLVAFVGERPFLVGVVLQGLLHDDLLALAQIGDGAEDARHAVRRLFGAYQVGRMELALGNSHDRDAMAGVTDERLLHRAHVLVAPLGHDVGPLFQR